MALWFGQKVISFLQVLDQETLVDPETLERRVTNPEPLPGFFVERPDGRIDAVSSAAIWDAARSGERWRLLDITNAQVRLSDRGARCLSRSGKVDVKRLEGQLSDILTERTLEWVNNEHDALDLDTFLRHFYEVTQGEVPSKQVIWEGLVSRRPDIFGRDALSYRQFGELLGLIGKYGAEVLNESFVRLYFSPDDRRYRQIRAESEQE